MSNSQRPWVGRTKPDPKSPPHQKDMVVAELANAIKHGAVVTYVCPLCGSTLVSDKLKAIVERKYGTCPDCGATCNERERANKFAHN